MATRTILKRNSFDCTYLTIKQRLVSATLVSQFIECSLTLSHPEAPPWWVKSSDVRQSKITRGTILASLGEKRLESYYSWLKFSTLQSSLFIRCDCCEDRMMTSSIYKLLVIDHAPSCRDVRYTENTGIETHIGMTFLVIPIYRNFRYTEKLWYIGIAEIHRYYRNLSEYRCYINNSILSLALKRV